MLDGEVPTKGVFQNASAVMVNGNGKLCGGISKLQLPPCPTKFQKKNHSFRLKIVLIVIIGLVIFLLFSSILVIYWVRKRNMKPSSDSPTIELLSKVSYLRLHQATDGFSPSNLIGSGSFGSVFKGILDSRDRVDVAIKVLNLQQKGAHKSFIAECNALKNIRHRNLVKILTCCSSTDYKGNEFKALVFEYMKNGSLDKWLHSGLPSTLNLKQRLSIIIDIAFTLHYLHFECEQPIIHCDLKPSNILLDDDMVAHVSDFGLARLLSTFNGTSHEQISTTGIKGTVGYTPPEYGMDSEVSTLGDTYSFGILILEMLTGRRPTDEMFKDGFTVRKYVETSCPNDFFQIVDPSLLPGEPEANDNKKKLILMNPKVQKCLISLLGIGLACSNETPKERMSIVDVTKELKLIQNDFLAEEVNGH